MGMQPKQSLTDHINCDSYSQSNIHKQVNWKGKEEIFVKASVIVTQNFHSAKEKGDQR